jgi:hypothetical protein
MQLYKSYTPTLQSKVPLRHISLNFIRIFLPPPPPFTEEALHSTDASSKKLQDVYNSLTTRINCGLNNTKKSNLSKQEKRNLEILYFHPSFLEGANFLSSDIFCQIQNQITSFKLLRMRASLQVAN